MSRAVETWLAHAGAASLGLVLAGLVLAVALRGLRARPVQGYRLAGVVLGAALVLPLVQAAAAHVELGTLVRDALAPGRDGAAPASLEAAPVASHLPLTAPFQSMERGMEPTTEPWLPPWLVPAQDAPVPGPVLPSRAAAETSAPAPLARLRSVGIALVALHVAGAVLCLARSLVRLARTRGVLRRARPVDAGDARALVALWRSVRARSRIGSRVRLCATDELASPACFGGRRPAILLPARDVAREGAGPAELARLRCALVHELVHLERADSRAMLVQELFRALFWFHPVAWWLAREVDRLREVSCDWIAVRRAGPAEGRVRRYASALVDFAARADDRRAGWAGHGAALVGRRNSTTQLRRRIDMLIALEARPPRRASRAALSLAALVLGAAWSAQTAFAAVWAPQDAEPARLAHEPARLALEPAGETRVRVASGPSDALASGAGSAREPAAEPAALEPQGSLGALGYASAAPAVTLGFGYEPAGEALAAHLGLDREHALVVTHVWPGSLAERVGLQRLDVLTEVDGEPLSSDRLARAKERLADGGSLRLGLVRRGQAQVQQVGPFTPEALEQGRAALQRGDEPDATWPGLQGGAWQHPHVPGVEFWNDAARRSGEQEAARAAELQARALEYYRHVDPPRFERDLDKALDVYRDLARQGRLDAEGQKHRALIEGLRRGGDTEAYLERTREALGAMTPEEFEEQVGGSLAKLDPAVRRGILERWGALAAPRGKPRTAIGIGGGAGTGSGTATGGGSGDVPGDVPGDVRGDVKGGLHEARTELERQAREIERLRRRLEELERARGGER